MGSSVLIWCGGLVCRWGHFSLQILPSWSPAVETASALLENLCVLFTLSGDSPNLQAAHGTNAPPLHTIRLLKWALITSLFILVLWFPKKNLKLWFLWFDCWLQSIFTGLWSREDRCLMFTHGFLFASTCVCGWLSKLCSHVLICGSLPEPLQRCPELKVFFNALHPERLKAVAIKYCLFFLVLRSSLTQIRPDCQNLLMTLWIVDDVVIEVSALL